MKLSFNKIIIILIQKQLCLNRIAKFSEPLNKHANSFIKQNIFHTVEYKMRMQWATENPLDGSIITYILSHLHAHNSLQIIDHGCFHPGIFPSDIT